ncbi:MAG: HAD family phosphatase [Clostridiales bacterium]|jgi:HAD superfamily hydrolase (TIGR01509 family)|nr:HAD family phosphatase [Clostridiales bacterium]
MVMINAAIFDLDGVLIDSQPVHFRTDMAVLAKYSRPVSPEVLDKYAGTPNHNRWEMLRRDFEIEASTDELIKAHNKILHEILDTEGLIPVKGAKQLLEALKENGYKTAVASSSSRDFVVKALKMVGFLNYFDELVCGPEVLNGKPAPDIFLRAARALDASLRECVIFEDSENGVKAANAAGILCIGYQNPTSGKQDLSLADVIIDSFYDLDKMRKYLSIARKDEDNY